MLPTGSYFLLLFFQVLLTTQGCMDGLSSCFKYFDPRVASLGSGPGVCDLVADQLDCLTMIRPSCDPGSAPNVDGAINGLQADSDYSNCTFDNIGQTPGYEVTQCTKLFGDCQSTIRETSCTRITAYEGCSQGISMFCTSDHLQNVTNIIKSERERLTAEQGCVFGEIELTTVTTQRVLLSGGACYQGFQNCYLGQGVDPSDHPCVLVPVYQACFQSVVSGVCDAASSSVVSSAVSDKQTECDALTTTTITVTTSTLKTTTLPLQTTAFQQETTTTTMTPKTTDVAQETTTSIISETTTDFAQETTTLVPQTSPLVQETTAVQQTTLEALKTTDVQGNVTNLETSPLTPKETTTGSRQPTAPTVTSGSPTNSSPARSIEAASSTMETIVVSEKGPGQIHLYYGVGSNLRCTELIVILGFSLSLVLTFDVIA